MLRPYEDITALIAVPPIWWDGNGVPRYLMFRPDLCGVYDNVVAFEEIACQSCKKLFHVSVEFDLQKEVPPLPVPSNYWQWNYGDPPAHGCTGDTEMSVPVRVLEFWTRGSFPYHEWKRHPEHEIVFEDYLEEL